MTWPNPDLPLILILSVYTDFLPLEFGKIQIFFLEIWQNTDFFKECERVFFIFSLFIQIFFSKILISLVIYTDFVLDHSGRSANLVLGFFFISDVACIAQALKTYFYHPVYHIVCGSG